MASKLCRNAVRWTGCLEWKKGCKKRCNFFKKTSWPLLFLLFSSMHHAGKKMRGCIKRVPHVTYYFTFIFPGSHLAPCHHHVTHTHQHLPTQMSKHRKKFIPPCLTLPSSEPACLWQLRNRKGTKSSLEDPREGLPPSLPGANARCPCCLLAPHCAIFSTSKI